MYVSPEQFNWNVPVSPRVWVFPRIYYSEWLGPSLFSFQNREKLLTETLLYSSLSPLFMQWNEEFAFWCSPLRHISVCFIRRVKSHREEPLLTVGSTWQYQASGLNLKLLNSLSLYADIWKATVDINIQNEFDLWWAIWLLLVISYSLGIK